MGIKGRVKQIAVFQIEVEMPQDLKQKDWEMHLITNIERPSATARAFPIIGKVRLIEKKVRYE